MLDMSLNRQTRTHAKTRHRHDTKMTRTEMKQNKKRPNSNTCAIKTRARHRYCEQVAIMIVEQRNTLEMFKPMQHKPTITGLMTVKI